MPSIKKEGTPTKMKMEVRNSASNESDDGNSVDVAKLKKELKRALQNDKLKTDLLNTLTKKVKAKDKRLAELEEKVASNNDDEKRQGTETDTSDEEVAKLKSKTESMSKEIASLQEKLKKAENGAQASFKVQTASASKEVEEWKSKSASLVAEIKTLQEKLNNEDKEKKAAEQWKEKADSAAKGVEEWKQKSSSLEEDTKLLKEKLQKEENDRKVAEEWKGKADSMAAEIKTLKLELQKEVEAKKAAEEWKGKFDQISKEAQGTKEKLHEESRNRLDIVEQMSKQQQAHKESLAKHQEMYTRGIEEVEARADALSKEAATLKEINLALQEGLNKANHDFDELQASHAALKSLDQDQKEQIHKMQTEISSLQTAKAELRRQWVSAAKKNEGFQKLIKSEKARTISELTYWKDMNERLYDSFASNEKLLQEAREDAENLKAEQDAWKLQMQDLTTQLAIQKADAEKERFALADHVNSLLRRNSHLSEEHNKLTITKDEFREQAEQATERIQQLECKVDNQMVQLKSYRRYESKCKELQTSLDELQISYDSLSTQYETNLADMQKERLQFKENFDSLMEEYQETTKNFIKARNLINTNAARFVDSEMTRQATTLLQETFHAEGQSTSIIPPELIIETPPSFHDIEDDGETTVGEEKKQDDLTVATPAVEGVDSMFSFESTKAGTAMDPDDDDEETVESSQASEDEEEEEDDDTITEDGRSLNRAEMWFWGLLEGDQQKSLDEKDGRVISTARGRKMKRGKVSRKTRKGELSFL